jgi:hypothetical protein
MIGSPGRGQQARELPTDTLAEAGGKVITARDLIERLELMPWPGKDRRDLIDSVKIRALQSLVAEQLLALESSTQNILGDSAWVMRTRALERLMVRDQLYRHHVLPKAVVNDADLKEGLKRFRSSMRLMTLVARSEADARKIYLTISRGPIDSAMRRIPSTVPFRQDTITINFGDTEKGVEDAAYRLQVGQAGQPLLIRRLGWTVLVLLDKFNNPQFSNKSVADRLESVRSIAKQQKELDESVRYQARLLSPRKAEANPEVFELLASTALGILRGDSVRIHHQGGYTLADILDSLIGVLKPHLGRTFVSMDDRSMTLWDVLESYRYLLFTFPTLRDQDFRDRLNGSVKEVVATEYLARQGYRENLQNSVQVRHDVATWVDFWRARIKERQLKDSVDAVDDEDIVNYCIAEAPGLGRKFEVNVREILTDSLQKSARLLQQILEGADMADLARQQSKRPGWAVRGGESLWFNVSAFPQIGFRALAADSGQLVGPIQLKTGFSIFRVLGKRRVEGGAPLSFDSLKTEVRTGAERAKLRSVINGRIASYARKYGAKIYYGRLKNVAISPQNMFTRRMIGFGGIMTAVPSLVPQWEWIKEAEDLKDILP